MERFRRTVEARGLGAVECGSRPNQRCRIQDDKRNRNGSGQNGLPAMTDEVATVERRMAGSVAIVRGAGVPRLACRGLEEVPAPGQVVCCVDRGGCMLRRGQGVSRSVGIGADNAGRNQRKRHCGCKQPGRPRFGTAAHREGLRLPRSSLMADDLARIKTEPWMLKRHAEGQRYIVA